MHTHKLISHKQKGKYPPAFPLKHQQKSMRLCVHTYTYAYTYTYTYVRIYIYIYIYIYK